MNKFLFFPAAVAAGSLLLLLAGCPEAEPGPGTNLSTLQVEDSVWMFLGEEETVTYTATDPNGKNTGVTVQSKNGEIAKVDSYSNGVIYLTGLKTGVTELTVTNSSDTSLSQTVSVVVSGTFPDAGKTDAHIDGELIIAFDKNSEPQLSAEGLVQIYEAGSNTLIDTINFTGERQTTLGTSNNDLAVGSQLVRAEGNKVFITPHFNKMQYEKDYYVVVPSGAITAAFNGGPFGGFAAGEGAWQFRTRAEPVLNAATPVTVDRAQNSGADFRSVYGAMWAVAGKGGDWTINVAPGVYTELVNYSGSSNITINGTGTEPFGKDVEIRWTNNTNMNNGTHIRASFRFSGADLVLKNVTLRNTTRRTDSGNWQAETLFFANGNPSDSNPRGRTVAAYNSSFFSYQDTIQTTGRVWFYKCHIEGDVDYIWGTSPAALFENCELVSIRDPERSTPDAVLFVARVAQFNNTIGKGYVLLNSKVTTKNTVVTWFGRNAGAGDFYDQAAVINTEFLNEGSGTIGGSIWRLDSDRYQFLEGLPEHAGWKLFGNTVDGAPQNTANMLANTTVMDEGLLNSEYSGRNVILNRVFDTTTSGYTPAAADWNISDLETAFGAAR